MIGLKQSYVHNLNIVLQTYRSLKESRERGSEGINV